VRDGIRYDPYSFSPRAEDYRASAILGQDSAFCVPKAILLAACLRAAGIPAEVGFADVKNHLNSPKLAEMMGTDVFIYHGYVKIWFGDETCKVTPAFNMELCERFGVKPLIFDGRSDALFHEYDSGGRRHMEYVRERGTYRDAPVEEILAAFRETYPRLHELSWQRAAVQDEAFSRR
jgi:transglutaminase-like putative cysteine protease